MPFGVDEERIAAAEEELGRRVPTAREGYEELFPEGAVVVADDHLLLLPGEHEPRRRQPRTGDPDPAPIDWSQASADAAPDD